MKMASCAACGDLEVERRVHLDAMDEFHEHFAREHRQCVEEYRRIERLFKEVVWYNFETVAQSWRHPWPETFGDSSITLNSTRCEVVATRGGRTAEKVCFPEYYAGKIRHAPSLPPAIMLHELKLAFEAVQAAETACAAPYEWAPGGRLYEKLLRESDGVRAYNALSSDHTTSSYGLLLGDPMERAPESEKSAPQDVLGRVCGDRCVVCEGIDGRHPRRGVGGRRGGRGLGRGRGRGRGRE